MNASKRTLLGLLCGAGISFGTPTLSHADGGKHHDDDVLESKLRSTFVADSRLRAYDVRVDVDDGVAELKGEVPSKALKDHATQVADQRGIKRVKNRIEVDGKVQALTAKQQADRRAAATRELGEEKAEATREGAEREAEAIERNADRKADAIEDSARRK